MTTPTEEMLHSQLRTANLQTNIEQGKLQLAETALGLANAQVELGNRTIRALRAFVWLRPMYIDPNDKGGWRCAWCSNPVNGSDEGHKQGCVYMAAMEVVGKRSGGFNSFTIFDGPVDRLLIEQARSGFHNKDAPL